MPQKGYVLITPLLDPERFQPESLTHCGNDVVVLSHHVALVNRGWVPESWKEMSRNGSEGQQRQQTGNAAKIDGLVVESEKPSMFVPENDPVKGTWFWIDAIEIVRDGLPSGKRAHRMAFYCLGQDMWSASRDTIDSSHSADGSRQTPSSDPYDLPWPPQPVTSFC